jgi:hypothetical protein
MDLLKGVLVGVTGFFICIFLLTLGITYVVSVTAGNADFMIREAGRIDFSLLAEDILRKAQNGELPPQFLASGARKINALVHEFAAQVVGSVYNYLEGKQELSQIRIPIRRLLDNLKPVLADAIYTSLKEQGNAPPKRIADADFSEVWAGLVREIPDTLEFDQSSLSAADLARFSGIREAYHALRYSYLGLLFFIAVFCALIFFIDKNIPLSCRHVGIMLLIPGVLQGLLIYLLHHAGAWPGLVERFPSFLAGYIAGLLQSLGDAFYLTTMLYLLLGSVFIGASILLPRLRLFSGEAGE